jgi:hypothetical protein
VISIVFVFLGTPCRGYFFGDTLYKTQNNLFRDIALFDCGSWNVGSLRGRLSGFGGGDEKWKKIFY